MPEAAARLRDLSVDSGARYLMFDVEELWTRNPAVRSANAEAKAKAIVDRLWVLHFVAVPDGGKRRHLHICRR